MPRSPSPTLMVKKNYAAKIGGVIIPQKAA